MLHVCIVMEIGYGPDFRSCEENTTAVTDDTCVDTRDLQQDGKMEVKKRTCMLTYASP